MLVLARGRFGSAPARVLDHVRRRGVLTREEIAAATGLSVATVARTTATLVEEHLLRERPDLGRPGTPGRPVVPLEIDPGHHAVLGVHIGRRVTTVGLVGLDGGVVGQSRLHSRSLPDELLAGVLQHARALLATSPERSVLAAGLVAPWGEIEHEEDALVESLGEGTGLRVTSANHVAAVAAAEFLGRSDRSERAGGCTAYVYVRDTAGLALANDLEDRTEISRVASLTHFPTRSDAACECGRRGCLVATVSDVAVAREAVARGIVGRPEIERVLTAARTGDAAADQLLRERARALGESAAVLRDMTGPDHVVLVGQAFTGYPPALPDTVAAYADATTLPPLEPTFTRFGTGVQAAAAGIVGLGPVFEDPLALVGRPPRRATC